MARHPLDRYETPPHYVKALLKHIGRLQHQRIYEPCSGHGHITRYLRDYGNKIHTNDLDPTIPAKTHLDARTPAAWGTLGYDWIITNPPFKYEQEILERALQFGKNVAFLARISFLEPTLTRDGFWRRYRQGLEVIILPRYSFRRNKDGRKGSDSVTCCWLIWQAPGYRLLRRQVQISLMREK